MHQELCNHTTCPVCHQDKGKGAGVCPVHSEDVRVRLIHADLPEHTTWVHPYTLPGGIRHRYDIISRRQMRHVTIWLQVWRSGLRRSPMLWGSHSLTEQLARSVQSASEFKWQKLNVLLPAI